MSRGTDDLRPCLLGSSRVGISGAKLRRVALPRHDSTFPLPPHPPSRAMGLKLDIWEEMTGQNPSEGRDSWVTGTGHLGTSDIFHDVCGNRIRVKVGQVSKQSLSFFWKNQAPLSRSEDTCLGSLWSYPPLLSACSS